MDSGLLPEMEELKLECVDHVFSVCKDCPELKSFLLDNSRTEISFRVSNQRRKHLHAVAQYFNDNQVRTLHVI